MLGTKACMTPILRIGNSSRTTRFSSTAGKSYPVAQFFAECSSYQSNWSALNASNSTVKSRKYSKRNSAKFHATSVLSYQRGTRRWNRAILWLFWPDSDYFGSRKAAGFLLPTLPSIAERTVAQVLPIVLASVHHDGGGVSQRLKSQPPKLNRL